MKKIVLVFGIISGVISSSLMLATVPFLEKIGDYGYYTGYTAIVLSFLLVYFGIRSYRDNIGGGRITFARGFGVGICITLISCVFYVATWEIIYFNFMPDFMDKYGARVLEKLRTSGASSAVIQAKMEEVQRYKAMYQNPLINAAMTFIEPFPVGVVITLISAGVLRRKNALPGNAASAEALAS